MKYDIFISYSRKDFDEVYVIKQQIEKSIPKIRIWFDITGVESGKEFDDKIVSAIDNTRCVLFAVSDNSIASQWTKDEVMYAKNIGKRVIPILLKGATLKGWFLFKFGRIDCIDYTNSIQIEHLYRDLIKICKNTGERLFVDALAKTQDIFLMIDASSSMWEYISSINTIIPHVVKNLEIDAPEVSLRINIMRFSNDARWRYNVPVPIKQMQWNDIEANGQKKLGNAMALLNESINSNCFCSPKSNKTGFLPPVFVLITTGSSIDDTSTALEKLQGNPFFTKASRFAIAIAECDTDILYRFTGSKKKIFVVLDDDIDNMDSLLSRLLTMGLYGGSCYVLDEDD